MRKVHAIITTGVNNVRPLLNLCSVDVMPSGWTESHDEHLLIVVDKFGLDDILSKVKMLPKLYDSVNIFLPSQFMILEYDAGHRKYNFIYAKPFFLPKIYFFRQCFFTAKNIFFSANNLHNYFYIPFRLNLSD